MLAIMRRFMLVLLAVTLASQLVEAQTLVCERMKNVAASHEGHTPMQQMDPAARERGATAPVSGDCVLAASCVNAPAIVADSGLRPAPTTALRALPEVRASAPFRSLRPDLPPPRS